MTLANLDNEKFKSTEIKKILMNEYRTLKGDMQAEEQSKEAYH